MSLWPDDPPLSSNPQLAGTVFPHERVLSSQPALLSLTIRPPRITTEGEDVVRTMRWPHSVHNFAFRICGLTAVIALLAFGGCGSDDKASFVGVEEQQMKEAEEHKGQARTATAPQ
jgi:hypothetical protein